MRSTIFRLTKYAIVLGVAIFCLGLSPAHADTVFDVTGTFTNGATLSGTITINTVTGSITGQSLQTSSPILGNFGFLVTQTPAFFYFAEFDTTASPSSPYLDLFFSAGSLVNYAGGSLCSESDNCFFGLFESSFVSLGDGVHYTELDSGYVSYSGFTNSTPEPGTILLLASGLAGLALLSRKRRAALTTA